MNRWLYLLGLAFVVFYGCEHHRRQESIYVPERDPVLGMLEGKRDYSFHWELERNEGRIVEVKGKALTDHGTYTISAIRSGVYPDGLPFIHKMKVVRSKDALFSKVDNSPFVKWSRIIDEDRSLWKRTFGEFGELVRFYTCVKSKKGCESTRDHLGDLYSLWRSAKERQISFSVKYFKDGSLKEVKGDISIDQIHLSLELKGHNIKQVEIAEPQEWIQDAVTSPVITIQKLQKVLKDAGIPFSEGPYLKVIEKGGHN